MTLVTDVTYLTDERNVIVTFVTCIVLWWSEVAWIRRKGSSEAMVL